MNNEIITYPLHFMKVRGPKTINLRRFVLFSPDDEPVEDVVGSHRTVHVKEFLLIGFELHLQLHWQEDPFVDLLFRYGLRGWECRLTGLGADYSLKNKT